MPNPLTVGRRATARLEEAILLALEEHRDQGHLNTLRLAERIGWDNDGMPSPNGQGYGRIAVIGLLYKLYLAGKVEPAHQPNRRGHWGGWRISDEEYARRSGEDAESVSPPRTAAHCRRPAQRGGPAGRVPAASGGRSDAAAAGGDPVSRRDGFRLDSIILINAVQ